MIIVSTCHLMMLPSNGHDNAAASDSDDDGYDGDDCDDNAAFLHF